MNEIVNLTGQRFGKLMVISNTIKEGKNYYCDVMCDCGNTKRVSPYQIRSGYTISCGCWKKVCSIKHGYSSNGVIKTEYGIWCTMKARCINPNYKNFHLYGGRGVKVCDRWIESFDAFLEDMGNRPSKNHSIDRFPDKDGNYEPLNCRWATRKEQQGNTRRNRWIEHNGRKMILQDWANEFNISSNGLRSLVERGLSMDKIQEKLSNRIKRKYTKHAIAI